MTTFQVKTESLAVRCDVCHQVDLFDPATGVCARCADITPPQTSLSQTGSPPSATLGLGIRPQVQSGMTFRTRLRNTLIGGVIGPIPLLIPSLILLGFNDAHNFPGFFLWIFAIAVLPSLLTGFWVGENTRSLEGIRSSREITESGGAASFFFTIPCILTSLTVLFFLSAFSNFRLKMPYPLELFDIPIFLVAIIGFFNLIGGAMIGFTLEWMERRNRKTE